MKTRVQTVRIFFLLSPMILLVFTSGCTTAQRSLKLSEVGKRQVEIYLDEPSSEQLRLGDGMRLQVRTDTNGTIETNEIGLGALSQPVQGSGFVIVWEDGSYSGPPVAEDFPSGQQGAVPGIKVADDFFGDIGSRPSEIRLVGERNRVSGLLVIFPMFTTDTVDDVVRFGQPPSDRPNTGGTFVSSGTLDNFSGSASLQRQWGGGGPVDNDAEADWLKQLTSWGVPTP